MTSKHCFPLTVFVFLFLLSSSPFLPPCLTYSLTRPHLSSSLNRKSVFLQCGSLPEIMEMVENFLVVRGEANSERSLSVALPASRHPSPQVCVSGWGAANTAELRREEPWDSCWLLLRAQKQQLKTLSGDLGRMGVHQASTGLSQRELLDTKEKPPYCLRPPLVGPQHTQRPDRVNIAVPSGPI